MDETQEIDATLLAAMTDEEYAAVEALIDGFLAQQAGDYSGFTDAELFAMLGL